MTSSRNFAPLALSAYAEDLIAGARIAMFGDATLDLVNEILDRGARLLHVYDPDPSRAAEASARSRRKSLAFASLPDSGDLGVRDGAFDFVIVPDLSSLGDPAPILALVRRILSGAGAALIASPNPECETRLFTPVSPGPHGAALGYYELYDAIAAHFASARMIGQAPFIGYTVTEFSSEGEAELAIDTSLAASETKEPEWFIALASDRDVRLEPFALIELPLGAARDLAAPAGKDLDETVRIAGASKSASAASAQASTALQANAATQASAALADWKQQASAQAAALETARDNALTARDNALTARDSALTVRDSALAARDSALAARDSALTAQRRAEQELALERKLGSERALEGKTQGSALGAMREELARARGELTRAREQLAESRGELTGAREQLAEGHGELARSREQLTGARAELARSQGELGELRAALARARDEVASRSQALQEQTKERARLETELERQRASQERASQELPTLRSRVSELEAAMSQVSEEQARELAALEANLRSKGRESAAHGVEHKRLERLVRELVAQLEEDRAASARATGEGREGREETRLPKAKEPTTGEATEGGRLADLHERLDRLAVEAARREADLIASSWKITQLERQLARQPDRPSPAHGGRIEELETALRDARVEMDALRQALAKTRQLLPSENGTGETG